MTAEPAVAEAARRIVRGDDSAQAASALEGALLDAHPFDEHYDDLLEALAMYAPALGKPYLNHSELCEAITESGVLNEAVE